ADAAGLHGYFSKLTKEIYEKSKPGDDISAPEFEIAWQYIDWMKIAGRDMTFSIWHFQKMILDIKGIQGQLPSLRGEVDTKKLDLTNRRYKGHFGLPKVNRDLVGHMAQNASSVHAVE
ncbi:unnamed protein product, partial [Hapterophycus canaliculatus]